MSKAISLLLSLAVMGLVKVSSSLLRLIQTLAVARSRIKLGASRIGHCNLKRHHPEPLAETTKTEPKFGSPIFHAVSFIVEGDKNSVSSVFRLLRPCCPADIARLIVAVVVYAFNRVVRSWAKANVTQKGLKIVEPFIAYANAPSTVIVEPLRRFFRTSLPHVFPDRILRAASHIVLAARAFATTATCAAHQVCTANRFDFSAFATTVKNLGRSDVGVERDYGEFAELLTNQINTAYTGDSHRCLLQRCLWYRSHANATRVLTFIILAVVASCNSNKCQCAGPGESVSAAAIDIQKVRAESQPYVRYLSLYHVGEKKELEQWDAVIRFWSNSLSRESEIVAPVRVAANLWRLDLRDYQWSVETWEKLAAAEPYYSVKVITFAEAKPARQVKEYWKGGINPADGKYYAPGDYMASYAAVEGKRVVKAAAGPWIPAQAFATLATATRSQIPIVRADWWLAEVTRGNDRGTGYYDWLGLGKKEADFLALGGVDVVKARALRKELGALVSRSTVTLNNRGLERYQSITGAYWKSRDYIRSTDTKNALRLLDGDIEEDANEEYLTLANGLFAFWLQDGKGNRADTAPDTIASDKKATGTDSRVHVGLSCVRCHVEGIRPINDWARKVYQPPFTLEDRLYEEQKRKRAKYLSDLTGQVSDDQAAYAKALKRTNGLTPAGNAKAVAAAWDWYTERDRTLADVASELGTDDKTLLAALKAEAKRVQLDPVLAGMVQGVDVRAEHVEELVPLLHEIIGRHKP